MNKEDLSPRLRKMGENAFQRKKKMTGMDKKRLAKSVSLNREKKASGMP
jgi:hypothetical protein